MLRQAVQVCVEVLHLLLVRLDRLLLDPLHFLNKKERRKKKEKKRRKSKQKIKKKMKKKKNKKKLEEQNTEVKDPRAPLSQSLCAS